MNFDLFIFTGLLLFRTIYMKFLNHQTYLGSSSWMRVGVEHPRTSSHVSRHPVPHDPSKHASIIKVLLVRLGIVGMMGLGLTVSWRLFMHNSFHNFICLFYP
jgi:hypothetical protein